MTGDLPREPAAPTRPPENAGFSSLAPLLDQDFDADAGYGLRSAVAAHATQAGLSEGRVGDLVAAVHELAANAVVHGPGHGTLRLWKYQQVLHCQISDTGTGAPAAADDPPGLWGTRPGGGLWLVRRLVDHMNLQTGPYGTIATISLTLGEPDHPAEFNVTTEQHGHVTVITVIGELDLRTVPELVTTVEAAVSSIPVPRLVLDLTRLRFWDSSGLAALLATEQRITAIPGARMILAGLSTQLLQRLQTIGMADRFILAADAHQAIAEQGPANG